jgi:branched-chain amino acid transport system ATP-binding protein
MPGGCLETRGLSVHFGGVRANNEVDLTVQPGFITGLIGPNGAGKTTFLDAVSGLVTSSGVIRLNGENVEGLNATRRVRRGLTRSFQGAELFPGLTVEENVAIAARRPRWYDCAWDGIHPRRSGGSQVATARALEILGIEDNSSAMPDELSNGMRKLVSVARAIAGRPAVVMLDEPAAGLDSSESQALGRRLVDVASEGISILLIDHDVDLVLTICSHVYVLDFGTIIGEGSPDAIRKNPAVIEAYLGLNRQKNATPNHNAVGALHEFGHDQ